MAMERKAPSKTPVVKCSIHECMFFFQSLKSDFLSNSALYTFRVTLTQIIPHLFNLSLLNKSIRGLQIACCALEWQFLFPNEVGMVFCFVLRRFFCMCLFCF